MSFWEKRKAAVAAEEQAERAAREATERAEAERALADRPEAELLEEAGFPAPEELTDPEQVRAFLKAHLPQALKTRALRRLWRMNPVLANLDGLVDYGEDYTDAARCLPDMKTAYKVGKGMFDKALEAAEAEAPDPVRDEDEGEAAPVGAPEPMAVAPEETEQEVPDHVRDAAAQDEIVAPKPRRMRFRFEDMEG